MFFLGGSDELPQVLDMLRGTIRGTISWTQEDYRHGRGEDGGLLEPHQGLVYL